MPWQLADLLGERRWMRRLDPFPHVVASRAFSDDFYGELDEAFAAVLARGFGTRPDQLSRRIAGYDAYGLSFPPDQPGPFGLFLSREWHDMLGGALGIEATGYITCGLHHHAPRGASGRIHNDLNPSWFAVYDGPGGVRVARHDLVRLTTGEVLHDGTETVEQVRAGVMLFYLHNPPWRPGDGGETGLYCALSDDTDHPRLSIPPLNNSLLAFECTPYSFHSFIRNRRSPRNCLIMWLHQERDTVAARWGDDAIVPWPAPR
jgi:2OG-Fe(II) oxygenase superfamily